MKQRRRRMRNQTSRAVLPPAKSIWGHVFRTVIQTAWDIAQGALSINGDLTAPLTAASNPTSWVKKDMDAGWMLAQGWLDKFKAMFNEFKVHRITAHYMPYAPITAMGEYIFTLWDEGQNNPEEKFTFLSLLGSPASVVRKSSQPAKLTWVPTEPEDRNWHPFSDGHKWCSASVASAETTYHAEPSQVSTAYRTNAQAANVAGKIIIEADVSARGKPSTNKSNLAPYGSAEYSAYMNYMRCTCVKCKRTSRPAFDYQDFLTKHPNWIAEFQRKGDGRDVESERVRIDSEDSSTSPSPVSSPFERLSLSEEGGTH